MLLVSRFRCRRRQYRRPPLRSPTQRISTNELVCTRYERWLSDGGGGGEGGAV